MDYLLFTKSSITKFNWDYYLGLFYLTYEWNVSLFAPTLSRACWLFSPNCWHFFYWAHHLPCGSLGLSFLPLCPKQHWKAPNSSVPYPIWPLSLPKSYSSFCYQFLPGVIFIQLNKHSHCSGKSIWKWVHIFQFII